MSRVGRPRFVGRRSTQVAFVVLLIACIVQVVWWLVDQGRFSAKVCDERIARLDRDADLAEAQIDAGASIEEVAAGAPHLDFRTTGGRVVVARGYRERLHEERARRMNRYGWEGTFFLAVLGGGLWIIGRALREGRRLVARQRDLLAAVTHEFKSPLASLRLSGETLGRRVPDDARRAALSERMLHDLDRLEAMVENLLGVARLEAGHMLARRERIVPARLAEDLVRQDTFLARERGVAVRVEATEGIAALADPRSVRLVLSNLIDNAVKSSVAEGGANVRVAVRRDGANVRLDVEDDGLGFGADDREHLFTRFWRAEVELRRRTSGTGLGLYLVERLVRLDGGRVDAASDGPGRGARFSVWWPAAAEETT